MKLLVFAHTPPPHHGQSYMVQLMLEGFGGDRRKQPRDQSTQSPYGIECYHVNARLSRNLSDIGEFRPGKLVLLVRYCLEAIWCRYRHGIDTVYYIPSPGKKSALLRDWIALMLFRPFFKHVVFHWHASGMGRWLEMCTQMRTRSLTYRTLGQIDLSIVLSRHGVYDAAKLLPHRTAVVANGIPDCCPDFETSTLPRRKARERLRKVIIEGRHLQTSDLVESGNDPHLFKILFMAHCIREKGLFDAVEGVIQANRKLQSDGSPLRFQLFTAGGFLTEAERVEFDRITQREDLRELMRSQAESLAPADASLLQPSEEMIRYVGFVQGQEKERIFREADCFCFPTYYLGESFGLVVAEAMAFGLPFVTTRWRALPEVAPPNYPWLVDARAPEQIAVSLLRMLDENRFEFLREYFLKHFLIDRHLDNLARAIHSVEDARETTRPAPSLIRQPT